MAAPSTADLQRICDSVQAAARLAGRLITQHAGHVEVETTKASPSDLVTAIDKECQVVIERHLADAHPSMMFLGEESVPAGSDASAAAIAEIASKPGYLVRESLIARVSGYQPKPERHGGLQTSAGYNRSN